LKNKNQIFTNKNLAAEVIAIHVVRKRGAREKPCNYVTIRTNFGIEGDYRSGKYQTGQITLIEAETMDTVSRKLGYKIPYGKSRRQIMVRGISLHEVTGYRLRLGSVTVEVEEECKPCNNMETRIGAGAKIAMEGKGGIRCRVIKGGKLHVGDTITIEDGSWSWFRLLLRLPRKYFFYVMRILNGHNAVRSVT